MGLHQDQSNVSLEELEAMDVAEQAKSVEEQPAVDVAETCKTEEQSPSADE